VLQAAELAIEDDIFMAFSYFGALAVLALEAISKCPQKYEY
jgi:hypothetical protein